MKEKQDNETSSLDGRERQTGKSLEEIRKDHRSRYELALEIIPEGSRILDIACGVGYGSFLLAGDGNHEEIIAVDRSAESITHGKLYFDHPTIQWLNADIYDVNKHLTRGSLDAICSFETMEHLKDDHGYLEILTSLLKPQGIIIISTPNQDVLPFDPEIFPFHQRHYSSQDFLGILEKHDLKIVQGFSQVWEKIHGGLGGRFNIALCQKKKPGQHMTQPLVRDYLDLLQKEEYSIDYFNGFGGAEARRLLEMGKEISALWLLEKWTGCDKINVEAGYLLGYLYKKQNRMAEALTQFKQVATYPVDEQNRRYMVSTLFHLAQMVTVDKEKEEYLKGCLALEPGHEKARELLPKRNK